MHGMGTGGRCPAIGLGGLDHGVACGRPGWAGGGRATRLLYLLLLNGCRRSRSPPEALPSTGATNVLERADAPPISPRSALIVAFSGGGALSGRVFRWKAVNFPERPRDPFDHRHVHDESVRSSACK